MSTERQRSGPHKGNGNVWRRLLRRLGIDFYPGEALPAILLFSSFLISYTFQYTVKSVRQATFIDALGAERLPWVYLLVALCSYPVLRLYSRISDRLSAHGMILVTCSLIAASMGLFWWLFSFPWIWVPLTFYIWVTILFVLISSQLWSYANHLFLPRQAKRLFGFIGAGGLLGSVAGGQVAGLATTLTGTRDALLVAGVLVLGIAALTYPMRGRLSEETADASSRGRLNKVPDGGLAAIRSSRQLQLISALLVVGVVVAQIVDLQFNWAVQSVTGDLDERTVFYGNVFSVMGISAFIFQLLFASRIHRSRGVGFSTKVLPSTIFVGTGVLLTAATFGPGAMVAAALALKISENGLRYSFDQSTRELLFLPVPAELRRRSKVFIDVFVQRGAKGLAAILLLPVTFGFITTLQASWISLVLIVVWMAVASAAAREYVRSFRRSLRQRAIDTDLPINVSDITTLEILVQSLGSSDPRQVLHSLEILALHDRHYLVPPLLLHHDDAEVRLKTLKVLSHAERHDALHLIERRLNDESPDVQAEAVRVLARLRNEDACEMMLPRLLDADPRVRSTAIASLIGHGDATMREQATKALHSMLSDSSSDVRTEAAKALGTIGQPEFRAELLQLLYDTEPNVVRQSIASIRSRLTGGEPTPIYLPTLISLLQNRRLKHEAREALISYGEAAVPALIHFLNDPDEGLWVRRAIPKTMARVGTPAATQALVDCLRQQSDSFLRRKLIEALALNRLRRSHRPIIVQEIESESIRYLQTLAEIYSLGPGFLRDTRAPLIEWNDTAEPPCLLHQLLAARLEIHLRNVFGLLALTHDPEHTWSAFRGLTSGRRDLRGNSLEYLDNALSSEIRRYLFTAISDSPLTEKLAEAERQYDIRVRSRSDTLRRLLRTRLDGTSDDSYMVAAALHLVFSDRIHDLHGNVAELQDSPDDFVRETALWVNEQIS